MEEKSVNIHIHRLVEHINDQGPQHQVKQDFIRCGKLFSTSKPTVATNVKAHEIKTLDYPPPTSKAYYSSPQKVEATDKLIQDMANASRLQEAEQHHYQRQSSSA